VNQSSFATTAVPAMPPTTIASDAQLVRDIAMFYSHFVFMIRAVVRSFKFEEKPHETNYFCSANRSAYFPAECSSSVLERPNE
jgi:hypothetical protein